MNKKIKHTNHKVHPCGWMCVLLLSAPVSGVPEHTRPVRWLYTGSGGKRGAGPVNALSKLPAHLSVLTILTQYALITSPRDDVEMAKQRPQVKQNTSQWLLNTPVAAGVIWLLWFQTLMGSWFQLKADAWGYNMWNFLSKYRVLHFFSWRERGRYWPVTQCSKLYHASEQLSSVREEAASSSCETPRHFLLLTDVAFDTDVKLSDCTKKNEIDVNPVRSRV